MKLRFQELHRPPRRCLALIATLAWSCALIAEAKPCDPAWSIKTSMQAQRREAAAATLGGTIYVMGGMDEFTVLSSVEAYDPATGTWTTKAPVPWAGSGYAAASAGGTLYSIAGAAVAYDPQTNTWTTKASMSDPRTNLAAVNVGGTIYAIGGYNIGPRATLEAYDPATNTWTTKAPMPTARYYLAAAVSQGRIFAIGGVAGGGIPLATVEAYDPATDAWTTMPGLPTARMWLAAAALNEKIYAIGGSGGPFMNTVEAWDPARGGWVTMAGMPTPRAWLMAATAGGQIYALGGSNGSAYLAVVEAGTPTGCTFDPTLDAVSEGTGPGSFLVAPNVLNRETGRRTALIVAKGNPDDFVTFIAYNESGTEVWRTLVHTDSAGVASTQFGIDLMYRGRTLEDGIYHLIARSGGVDGHLRVMIVTRRRR